MNCPRSVYAEYRSVWLRYSSGNYCGGKARVVYHHHLPQSSRCCATVKDQEKVNVLVLDFDQDYFSEPLLSFLGSSRESIREEIPTGVRDAINNQHAAGIGISS